MTPVTPRARHHDAAGDVRTPSLRGDDASGDAEADRPRARICLYACHYLILAMPHLKRRGHPLPTSVATESTPPASTCVRQLSPAPSSASRWTPVSDVGEDELQHANQELQRELAFDFFPQAPMCSEEQQQLLPRQSPARRRPWLH